MNDIPGSDGGNVTLGQIENTLNPFPVIILGSEYKLLESLFNKNI